MLASLCDPQYYSHFLPQNGLSFPPFFNTSLSFPSSPSPQPPGTFGDYMSVPGFNALHCAQFVMDRKSTGATMNAHSFFQPNQQLFLPAAVEIPTPTARGAEAAMKYVELCAAPMHLKLATRVCAQADNTEYHVQVILQALQHHVEEQLSTKEILELAGLQVAPKTRKILKMMVADGRLLLLGKGKGTLCTHVFSVCILCDVLGSGSRYSLAKGP
jgi:hypothetical protein